MKCYINRAITHRDVVTDIKLLIPEHGLRRRMSRVVKIAVATAVECLRGVENITLLDAIITATGWGCLADSERFLRNIIHNKEQLLNPTPFIQSTFNTVGGQIALLRHNHCYNVTYVNRSHSFEDALLDGMMRISDGESKNILIGAFDEQTSSQHKIMERMGLFRHQNGGEGAMFMQVVACADEHTVAQVVKIDFLAHSLSKQDCIETYVSSHNAKVLFNTYAEYGAFPTSSAQSVVRAVRYIEQGTEEVVVYNEYLGAAPVVLVLQCVG